MITLRLESQAVLSYLTELRRRMTDLTPAMRGIATELEARVSARFETESDPSGQPWAELKPSTRRRYPQSGNYRLLDRYGDMLDSLNSEAGRDYAQVGFGVDYAAYHEWGTQTMVPRRMLTKDPNTGRLAEGDEQAILDLLRHWIDRPG